MKAKLAVMLLCMIILSAPDGQSSPAKGESKSETWTVAEKLFETAIGVEFLNMPEDHSNKLDGFISMLSGGFTVFTPLKPGCAHFSRNDKPFVFHASHFVAG